MKKTITALLCVMLCLTVLSGCGNSERYSVQEREAIATAISMVEEKYNTDINESKYLYSVGKQVSENEFVALDNNTAPEEQYQNIISVSAMNNHPDKGDTLLSFAVIYNSLTKEIVAIYINK